MAQNLQKTRFNLTKKSKINVDLYTVLFVRYSMIKGDINMNDKCTKCKEHSSTITYKDKNYCNWYCAKKG